jgi:hypothetical protein
MAFTLTWADVLLIAPDLSTLATAERAAVLADVDAQLDEDKIGADYKYQLACKYLAAHFGTLVKRGAAGAVGPVSSESVGSVSISYAVTSAMSSDGLSSTVWGAQYVAIIRQLRYRVGAIL